MKSFKKIICLLCVMLLSVSAALAAESALTKDTLLVGTESTYKPYQFRDENGRIVGYEVDLVERIGEKMGKKIEWVDMAFDALVPAVITHKVDFAAACMAITEERKKRVAFSDPDNTSTENAGGESVFCVPVGNEKHSKEEFIGKVVAAQLGTAQYIYVSKIDGITVKPYQKIEDCLREVLYGRVDAAFVGGPTVYEYLKSKEFNGRLSMCTVLAALGTMEDGFAVNKDDPELLEALNKSLQEMKDSGEYAAYRKKWGLDDWVSAVVRPAE